MSSGLLLQGRTFLHFVCFLCLFELTLVFFFFLLGFFTLPSTDGSFPFLSVRAFRFLSSTAFPIPSSVFLACSFICWCRALAEREI